jgi:protein TonB
MGAGFRLPRVPLAYAPVPLGTLPIGERQVQGAFALSILAHALLILFVTIKEFDYNRFGSPELEVVLVNSKSNEKPLDPLRRAQANLNGGGNTDEDRVIKTPLPALNDELARQAAETERRVRRLEGEARTLMARIQAEQQLREQRLGAVASATDAAPSEARPKVVAPVNSADPADPAHGLDPSAEGLAFARQAAEISRNFDAYQKRPRRKEIGGRAVAYTFARYEDEYRTRVERVGTINYPAPHNGQPVYGKVRLTVSVKSDGSIEKIVVNTSSGDDYLDREAARIVELSAPFGHFTVDMLKEADILDITRTFTFTRLSEGMHSE